VEPLGEGTDQGDPVVSQVEGVGGQDRDDHCRQHGRELGNQPLEQADEEQADEEQAEQADRQHRPHRLAVGQPLGEAGRFGDEPIAVHGEAEQLGELADRIVRASPFM
jgi:hypothetical protein